MDTSSKAIKGISQFNWRTMRELKQDVLNGIMKVWNISIPPQQPTIELHRMSKICSPSRPLLDNLNT